MRVPACRAIPAAAAVCLTLCAGHLHAQQWDALLLVDPLPSPYLSDWEIDPNIGELSVTNPTSDDAEVTFHYTLARDGGLVVRGITDPHLFLPGETRVFTSTFDFGGEADWDLDFEDLIVATGRLPEGEYEGCVSVVDANGFVLADDVCAVFYTMYPEPPGLVFPFDGDTVSARDPIFEWLPIQLPTFQGFRTGYVFELAEVPEGQRPEVAIETAILHHLETDLSDASLTYPAEALPLEPGTEYAWRVQALDGDGMPVAANNGRSEVFSFVYQEPLEQPVASGTRISVEIGVPPDIETRVVEPESDALEALDEVTRLGAAVLCRGSGVLPQDLRFPVSHPVPFDPWTLGGTYYWDATKQSWAIRGFDERGRDYLLVGNCDAGLLSRYWAAFRPPQDRLTGLIPWEIPTQLDDWNLTYGVVLLAPSEMTISPDSLPAAVQDFLPAGGPGRRIEFIARRGFNAFGVLDVSSSSWMDGLLEALDFPATEVEVTGFLGWNNNGTQVTGSTTIGQPRQTRLARNSRTDVFVLRAAVPRRTPTRPAVRSIVNWGQLGIEFAVTDSTSTTIADSTGYNSEEGAVRRQIPFQHSAGEVSKAALELRLTHTMELQIGQWDPFEANGTLGLQLYRQSTRAAVTDSAGNRSLEKRRNRSAETAVVFRYGTDDLAILDGRVRLTDPELVVTRRIGGDEWNVGMSAGYGLGAVEDIGRVAVQVNVNSECGGVGQPRCRPASQPQATNATEGAAPLDCVGDCPDASSEEVADSDPTRRYAGVWPVVDRDPRRDAGVFEPVQEAENQGARDDAPQRPTPPSDQRNVRWRVSLSMAQGTLVELATLARDLISASLGGSP